MQKLAYFFIGLGLVDFGASLVGIDFYAYFGIHLTGYAYEYSPFVAGILGFVLIYLDKNKDIGHQIESSLNKDEEIVLTKLVSVRKGGIFSGIESGTFFLTNQRIGYMGNFSQKGEDVDTDAVGDYNFSCPLKNIKSVNGSRTAIEISHGDETFKFEPGLTKVKEIVAQIEKQME